MVDASLCHACHAPVPLGLSTTAPRHRCRQAQEKQTQGDKSGPSAPPSAICPTPATQNDGGCEFVPRLPRSCSSWLVNYCPTTPVQTSAGETNTGRQIRTKRATQYHLSHACHAKRRWMRVCATPATLLFLLACQLLPHDTGADKRRRNKHRATNSDQARHPVPSVPHLPRKTTVDVTLCHACTSLCM